MEKKILYIRFLEFREEVRKMFRVYEGILLRELEGGKENVRKKENRKTSN